MMELKTYSKENVFNPNDLETAFRYKSNEELGTARFVFRLIRNPFLTRLLIRLVMISLKIGLPVKGIIRKTVFKVFIAGENISEAMDMIRRLERFQVHSVLDYVAEEEQSADAYQFNAHAISNNIRRLGETEGHHSVSLKISGLENTAFLASINERLSELQESELKRFEELVNRVDEICRMASVSDVCVYIDAETYETQKLYDHIAELMMERYNKGKVFIYNTLQMYLKDRLDYLRRLDNSSRSKGYMPGVKLVRGAYLEKERAWAVERGQISPVYDDKSSTDNSFDSATRFCLDRDEPLFTCVASHNHESVVLALDLISQRNGFSDRLRFSQLYGMSDNLTFNLAFSGRNASKYLPYGELEKALPYMTRRAEENTSIGAQMGRELEMINKEYKRRIGLKNKR